uniref:Uncharacterized protein n=1 Tax=Aegilops tauschii subsp. strangulata TaxID=200361 RepID=A0A452ZP02_AEGTS
KTRGSSRQSSAYGRLIFFLKKKKVASDNLDPARGRSGPSVSAPTGLPIKPEPSVPFIIPPFLTRSPPPKSHSSP